MTVWSDCNAKQSFGIGESEFSKVKAKAKKQNQKQKTKPNSMLLLFTSFHLLFI